MNPKSGKERKKKSSMYGLAGRKVAIIVNCKHQQNGLEDGMGLVKKNLIIDKVTNTIFVVARCIFS